MPIIDYNYSGTLINLIHIDVFFFITGRLVDVNSMYTHPRVCFQQLHQLWSHNQKEQLHILKPKMLLEEEEEDFYLLDTRYRLILPACGHFTDDQVIIQYYFNRITTTNV